MQRLQGDGRVGGTVSRRDRARVRPGPHGPTRKSGRSPVRQSVHSTSSGRGVRGKEKFCSEAPGAGGSRPQPSDKTPSQAGGYFLFSFL